MVILWTLRVGGGALLKSVSLSETTGLGEGKEETSQGEGKSPSTSARNRSFRSSSLEVSEWEEE
jgi:hypothetical protein